MRCVLLVALHYHFSFLEESERGQWQQHQLPCNKRAHSLSPVGIKQKNDIPPKKNAERKCQSLSPSTHMLKKVLDRLDRFAVTPGGPDGMDSTTCPLIRNDNDNNLIVPQCVMTKMLRVLATKKREFMKLRKSIILQQNTLLENYAQLKEIEGRVGVKPEEFLGEIRVLSVSGWPAHDLLLLVRDDIEIPLNNQITGVFGPNVLQQMSRQLNPIPEEISSICQEILDRRMDLLNLLRSKHRTDRATYLTNLEWKSKNLEFDTETENLCKMVAKTSENLKAKIKHVFELAKIPWVDRETLVKKMERTQKENIILQSKLDDFLKQENETRAMQQPNDVNYQALSEELNKERAAREALKDVVTTAESMLRVAHARIANLERQLKETRAELELSRKKQKDLEQLYRHRESSFDARSKKLIEVSKTGEHTIETLSRQRDALEFRVKELREQTQQAELAAKQLEIEQHSRVESLQAKVAEQEKMKSAAEERVVELENKIKELEQKIQVFKERSVELVGLEHRCCLENIPPKVTEPSDKETEIWKELQVTRMARNRLEDELRQSRADKDSFLNTLSRIAQEGSENVNEKIAKELLDREQKIVRLQRKIDEHQENEKIMEQSMTQYENELAALRLEVLRLRNYDNYSKEATYPELQTQLLELHMQVATLTRERKALVTAAASRALMLERHERSADMFARTIRARRELCALLDGRVTPPPMADTETAEISRSLSTVSTSAAETWSALRVERSRVLRLESAVLAQNMQLDREGQVRTQLERRRAILERAVMRGQSLDSSECSMFDRSKFKQG